MGAIPFPAGATAFVWPDTRGQRCALPIEPRLTVGRAPDNDVVLAHDPLASRRHCRLERRDDGFWIVDLDSRFGTFVNGERVSGEKRVMPGDQIRVGNTTAELSAGGADDGKPHGLVAHGALDRTVSGAESIERVLDDAQGLALALGELLRDPASAGSFAPADLGSALVQRITTARQLWATAAREHALDQALADVGKLVNLVTDVDVALKQILALAVEALGAERGLVLLRGADGKFSVRTSRNMGEVPGISESIASRVADNVKPVLTTDAQTDSRFRDAPSVMMHSIRAVMCVPLLRRDRGVMGAIYVDGSPGAPLFNERGLDFLIGFASQAATAIESAQLAEQQVLEERRRRRFARYLSPAVVEQVLQGDVEDMLGGVSREVTLLFTDIRGFTALLERLRPEDAVEMLNSYFSCLIDAVLAEEGTLDKFTGDGIMAFWNAPKDQGDHALRALRAALRIQALVPQLVAQWKREARPFAKGIDDLKTGIGIHTGEAVVGNIGSAKRMEFTAIGDSVNVTARVQGHAAGGEVLITGPTLVKVASDVIAQPLPPVPLKGRMALIQIHRVTRLVSD